MEGYWGGLCAVLNKRSRCDISATFCYLQSPYSVERPSIPFKNTTQICKDGLSMAFRTFGREGSDGGIPISIEYIEKPGLGRIALVNFVLILATLSIYRFWAKTNVRRHIWSCVHI